MQEVFSAPPFVLLRNFPAGHTLHQSAPVEAAAEYVPEGHCKSMYKKVVVSLLQMILQGLR
jgi:hypothetical protein